MRQDLQGHAQRRRTRAIAITARFDEALHRRVALFAAAGAGTLLLMILSRI
jgi:hypothetical protein